MHGINLNTFTSNAPLLPRWSANLANYSNNSGYVGILAQNKLLLIGNNGFSNLRNGIISESCDCSSFGNTFTNISGLPPANPAFLSGSAGIGILANRGKLTASSNDFTNMHTGVFTDNNPIDVKNNNFLTNIGRGVFSRGARSADIAFNDFQSFAISGITLTSITPENNNSTFSVFRNVVQSSGNNLFHDDAEWAISADMATNMLLDNASISSNTVTINDNTGGIRLRNLNGWTVGSENNLTYAGGAPSLQANIPGFRFENGGEHFIFENSSTGNFNQDGFQTTFSTNNTFCCNKASQADGGFVFMGACLGTQFRVNEMTNTTNCLLFTDMTRISPQPDHANRFLTGSGFALHEGSIGDINQSMFFINDVNMNGNADPGDAPWYPSSGATPDLFAVGDQNNTSECGDDLICASPPGVASFDMGDQDNYAANSNPDNSVRGTTLHWESGRALYNKLSQNPELLGEDVACDQFFAAQHSGAGVYGKYADAEQWIRDLHKIPAVWASRQSVIADSLSYLQNLINAQLAELEKVSTAQDTEAIYALASLIAMQKVPWLNESDSLAQMALLWQRNEAKLLLSYLETLPNTHTAMYNRKAVLMAYTRYLFEGSPALGSTTMQEIGAMALQCPLEGGSAVYLARSLYSLFGGEQNYDDFQACDSQERILASVNTDNPVPNRLRIVPNPARDRCLLQWDVPATAEGIVQIWSGDGRLVQQFVTPIGSTGIEAQTAQLANGLYFCHYQVNNQRMSALLSIQN